MKKSKVLFLLKVRLKNLMTLLMMFLVEVLDYFLAFIRIVMLLYLARKLYRCYKRFKVDCNNEEEAKNDREELDLGIGR